MRVLAACFALLLFLLSGCETPPAGSERVKDYTGVPFRDASPRWSPDGSQITFLRIYEDRQAQLWIANSKLTDMRPLTEVDAVRWARPLLTGRAAHSAPDAPAWSPDGKRIAFSRSRKVSFDAKREIGGTDLWTVDARSGKMATLAFHPAGYDGDLHFFRAPAWSPSGKHVAYLAQGIYGYSSVVIHTLGATAPNSAAIPVDMLDNYGWPVWSPDGRWLAFRQSIFQSESALPVEAIRITAPGAARTRTVPIKSRNVRELWRVSHLAWSQDSRYLAFSVRPSEKETPVRQGMLEISGATGISISAPIERWISGLWIRKFGRSPELFGLRKRSEGGYVLSPIASSEEGIALPSDDFDVDPDAVRLVVHDPRLERAAARTTLRLLELGNGR